MKTLAPVFAIIFAAALLLATGTAHAKPLPAKPPPPEFDHEYPGIMIIVRARKPEPESGWRINCRKVEIWYEGGEENDAQPGHLTLKDIREIEKLIPYLKKCDAFWECVARRGTKWPEGHEWAGRWVYPPAGSKSIEQPDGNVLVYPSGKRPRHCYPPRGPDGTPLNT